MCNEQEFIESVPEGALYFVKYSQGHYLFKFSGSDDNLGLNLML